MEIEELGFCNSVIPVLLVLFDTLKLLRISVIDFSLMLVLFLCFLIIFLVKQ